MRIVRFLHKKQVYWGRLEGETIVFLAGEQDRRQRFSPKKVLFDDVRLLAPVAPSKVVCVGLNYKGHAVELRMPVPAAPLIFIKPSTSVIGPGEKIIYPAGVGRLDYEAELAVVIAKTAKNVPFAKVGEYVLGYTCLNDVTARDLQKNDGQWTRAKSFDTFCPLGPWIETELDTTNLEVRSLLNGKVCQDDRTSGFIFTPDALVVFISGVMTLLPGDVIATGTPMGVGPMLPGDTIEVDIEGIGKLTNKVEKP